MGQSVSVNKFQMLPNQIRHQYYGVERVIQDQTNKENIRKDNSKNNNLLQNQNVKQKQTIPLDFHKLIVNVDDLFNNPKITR